MGALERFPNLLGAPRRRLRRRVDETRQAVALVGRNDVFAAALDVRVETPPELEQERVELGEQLGGLRCGKGRGGVVGVHAQSVLAPPGWSRAFAVWGYVFARWVAPWG